jgi:hypothetical protein
MPGEFKTSGGAMSSGSEALMTAARQIEAANANLQAAYRRLQAQWTSSDARGRADKEYNELQACLEAMMRWATGGSQATDALSELFQRVEQRGAFA